MIGVSLHFTFACGARELRRCVLDMWLARHTPENTMPIIEKVLRAVRETYADTAYDASVGVLAVGYCFGAKYVLRLAATDEIVAGVAAHGLKPGFLVNENG